MEIVLFQNKTPSILSPDTPTTFTSSPLFQMRSLKYMSFSPPLVHVLSLILSYHCKLPGRAALSFWCIFLHILFLSEGKSNQNKTKQNQSKVLFAVWPHVVSMQEFQGSDSVWQHPNTVSLSSLLLDVSSTNIYV